MAATNFTPIILYHSVTASAAPSAGNLNNGELAINITDGKLFYKDNGGVVQIIATKGTAVIGGSNNQVQYNSSGALAGSANFTFDGTTATINTLNLTTVLDETYGGTGLTSYTTGDVIYASGSNTLAKLAIGANTYILTSTGSVPQWSAPSAVSVSTATNLAGGTAGAVPYQSGAGSTTFLSIGTLNQVLTSTGSAPQWSSGLTLTTLATTGNTTLGDAAADNLTINATVTSNLIFTDNTYDIGASGATRPRTIYAATSIFAPLMDATNLEVTNIKAKDGTAAMSIADSTGNVTVSSAFAANGGVTLGDASGDAFTINSSAVSTPNGLNFDSNTFVIDAANNRVGIGQASPARTLDVYGSIQAADASGIQTVLWSQGIVGGGGVGTNNNFPLALLTNGTEKVRITSGGQVNIGGNFTSTNNILQVTGNAAIGDTLAGPTDGLYVKGNVGIGTNSPQGPLEVAATGATVNQFLTGGTGNNAVTGIFRIGSGSGRGASIQGFRGGSSNIHSLDFYTYNSADVFGMRLDSSGNLGIATTSPAGKLSVNVDASTQLITFRDSSGRQIWAHEPGGNARPLTIKAQSLTYADDSATRLTVDTSGNLGLGVTPSAWTNNYKVLETQSGWLGGNDPNTVFFGQNNFVSSGNFVYKTTAAATQYRQAAGQHQWFNAASGTANTTTITNGVSYTIITSGNQTAFGAANNNVGTSFTANASGTLSSGTVSQNISFTQAMTLDASGNLLVGTTSTSGLITGQLQLGTTSAATAGIQILNSTTGVGGIYFGDSTTGNARFRGMVEYNHTADALVLSTAETERARITSGGYFKASNAGTYLDAAGAYHELRSDAASLPAVIASSTNASFDNTSFSVEVTRNTTNNSFYALGYYNRGASAYKFRVADSGSISTAGSIQLGDAGAPPTSGVGVKFPATQSASSDANTLDDYEEGTWTPVLRDGPTGNAATATISGGSYVKIGRFVTATCRLVDIVTTGLTAGNLIYITGLPFTSNADANFENIGHVQRSDVSASVSSLYWYIGSNVSYASLGNDTAAGQSNAVVSQITSGSGDIRATFIYQV